MANVNDFSQKINEGWEKIRVNALLKLENYLTTGQTEGMFTKKEWMDYYT
jgi:predicted phage tail protein